MHHVTAPVLGIVMLYSGGALLAPEVVSGLFSALETRAEQQIAGDLASDRAQLARVD